MALKFLIGTTAEKYCHVKSFCWSSLASRVQPFVLPFIRTENQLCSNFDVILWENFSINRRSLPIISTIFQGICKIPIVYNFVQAFLFIKFLFLIEKFSRETNRLFEQTLNTEEKLDALSNILFEVNEASKLLSSCFGAFLLASIAAQFIVLLNLFYYLFLTINGFIDFSVVVLVSTLCWICFQICVLTTFVVGCEKVYKETTRPSRNLWKFNCARIKKSTDVRNDQACPRYCENH